MRRVLAALLLARTSTANQTETHLDFKAFHNHVVGLGPQRGDSVPWQRTAYATLWFGASDSTSSFNGLEVMVHSLRQHDRLRRMIIMSTNAAALDTDQGFTALRRRGAPLSWVQVEPLSARTHSSSLLCQKTINQDSRSRLHVRVWAKFAVWTLTDYARVLYIDADVVVLHPIDHVWHTDIRRASCTACTRAHLPTQ